MKIKRTHPSFELLTTLVYSGDKFGGKGETLEAIIEQKNTAYPGSVTYCVVQGCQVSLAYWSIISY
jgi:hypothetical protein